VQSGTLSFRRLAPEHNELALPRPGVENECSELASLANHGDSCPRQCSPGDRYSVRGERGPKVVPVDEAGLSSARQSGDRARLPCHRASGMPFGSGWRFTPVVSAGPEGSGSGDCFFEAGYTGRFKTRDGITPVVATSDTSERTELPHLEDTCPVRASDCRPSRNCQSASCAQAPSRPEGRSTRGGRSERRAEPCRCRAQIDHQSVMADASAVVSLAILIPTPETVPIA
jgi:hypothetical protein